MFLYLSFFFWSAGFWCIYGLQFHLQDTHERLEPYLERQIFQHHPHNPSEYRLLRGQPYREERSVGEEKEDLNPETISISLPVNGVEVHLTLNQVNIADPGLTLKVHGEGGGEGKEEEEEVELQVPINCFYAGGGDDGQFAVISTCTGMNGVVNNGGVTYQVEQISSEDERLTRHRRHISQPLFIIYPVKSQVSEKKDLLYAEDYASPATTLIPSLMNALQRGGGGVGVEDGGGRGEEGGRAGRVRRRIEKGPYTVELGVFVDRTLYSYIKKRYPTSNQNTKTVEIVMTLVNAVHRIYSDSNLGDVKVGMLVKKVEVLPSNEPSSAKGDIYKYLKNFCQWQKKERPKGSAGHWDHALLLSGHDLWNDYPSQNSTVGLAYVGGMCSSSYSCTVNEATTFAAAYIIAHEMGHNFDMKHDGSQEASSCSANKYIMSPVMASGATKWSSCSKSTLKSFLKYRGSCLTESATSTTRVGDKTHEGKAPGKRFDADDQCHYMYGKDWNHFTTSESPFNNVCREIWCRNGRLLKTPTASALEGTPCGKNKICSHGICTTDGGGSGNGGGDHGDDDKDTDDDNKIGNGWDIINIVPHDDGDASPCTPQEEKEEDCDNYTTFLGSMLGNSFLGGVFNSIFKGLGVCSDKCKQ